MKGLCRQLGTVVLDSSPLLLAAETVLAARMAEGVLLVLGAGKVTREEARAASTRLQQAGCKIFGTVLNNFNPKRSLGSYSKFDELSIQKPSVKDRTS